MEMSPGVDERISGAGLHEARAGRTPARQASWHLDSLEVNDLSLN
jgi:hypothetical protein